MTNNDANVQGKSIGRNRRHAPILTQSPSARLSRPIRIEAVTFQTGVYSGPPTAYGREMSFKILAFFFKSNFLEIYKIFFFAFLKFLEFDSFEEKTLQWETTWFTC